MRTRLAGASPEASDLDAYERRLGFGLDKFQRRAMAALGAGRSVLVAAPTGAGKTLVAEHGIDLARSKGLRAVYTTPLKALSNQKYADLGVIHGTENVGLLTGDHSIRPWAPVVVMTTEVLRNMLYADSRAVDDVGVVVLDEVHYLQDRYRGGVWEEVIIHLPPQVALVALSATVSNAEEFGGWVETLRGDTEVVIEETRPVPLEQLFCVGVRDDVRLLPLFGPGADADAEPVVNPAITRLERGRSPKAWRGGPLRTPRRSEVIESLDTASMLPAIYFIFSRRGCDRAVAQLQVDGTRLTTSAERAEIKAIADAHVAGLADDDLDALGYKRFRSGLEAGLAAHHAGMVPAFRETVEALFLAGLVKVVFATETLSLGVNMPARTVVIEKLTKFGGERHEPLTPGQYTQLTGRAGRRGIDASGNAVVLWSPFQQAGQIAELASTRTYELQSSFRPTYNMAANLVARGDRETAHRIVNSSFAQYRVDKQVVRLEASATRRRRAAQEYWDRARCERGDIAEYVELLDGGDEVGVRRRGRRRPGRPGDVAPLKGRPVVVLRRVGTDQKRMQVVGADAKPRIVTRRQLGPLLGRVDLPQGGAAAKGFLARAVDALAAFETREPDPAEAPREAGGAGEYRRHPCHGCPEIETHLRWARRARRDSSDAVRVERRVRRRSESLSRRFDAVCGFLEELGHLDGWALTPKGELLARLYAECDLVVAEAIWAGHLSGLSPPEYASAISVFTFEARIEGPAEPPPAVRRVRDAVAASLDLGIHLGELEDQQGLERTRDLDDGFCGQSYDWAAGRPLESVLIDDLGGGDFVRNVKQVVDLSKQVHEATLATGDHLDVGAAAIEAAERMWRGVVAVTGVIEE